MTTGIASAAATRSMYSSELKASIAAYSLRRRRRFSAGTLSALLGRNLFNATTSSRHRYGKLPRAPSGCAGL